jgi:hypothetical protein
MPLVLNGATSGSTTIQATDAVTATLTLPSSTGTLALSGASVTYSQLPAGTVLQTVTSQLSAQTGTTTTSTSFVTTGHTLTITPKFSTSKILLILSSYCGQSKSSDGGAITFYRNGSNVLSGSGNQVLAGSRTDANTTGTTFTLATSWVDSPATTSATTYTVYMLTNASANTFTYACANGGLVNGSSASLTALEIAA